VLFLFLPVLLCWESLTTSLREIRPNLRGIVMVSTLLVFVTAAAVAAAAHALGMPWGPAWVLGAAVAPTDATAVGVLARALPRRSVTTLRAESLINDGTALVSYGLAVGITAGEEHLSAPHVGGLLLLSYGGGILAGLATAWLGIQVRRRLADPVLENVAILLFPFTAYLLAGLAGASGVLAVVVCGLIMSQAGPRIGHAGQRRQAEAFWSLAMFLLNSALFVLVGLELQAAARKLTGTDLVGALLLIAVISAMLVIVRLAFLYVAVYLIRLIDRRPQQRLRRVSNRSRVVSGLAGFRGAVSLAVALSVPAALHSGRPFPDRNLIIFVTSGVIVMTLLQALVLRRWSAGRGCPLTPPSMKSVSSRRPRPSRRRSPPCRGPPPTWARRPRLLTGSALSMRRTCWSCMPAAATPQRCASRMTTTRCGSCCPHASGPPSSGSATNAASTTSCSASCRPGSTSTRYA